MALPDDGRMSYADSITLGNTLSASISPAFKAAAICLNLCAVQNFSDMTDVIKWRKSGSLTAAVLAEGQVYLAANSTSKITDSSVSTTAAKAVVGSPVSYEVVQFGAGAASMPRISGEQGRAIARQFDSDFKALITSITATAPATSTMDIATIITGQYQLRLGEMPVGPMVALCSHKQVAEIKQLIAQSSAAQFANQSQLVLLNGTPTPNMFVGNYLGTDFYETSSLPASGAQTAGVLFNPLYAFCAGLGGAVQTDVFQTGAGVASQIPGFSWYMLSYLFYNVAVWNNAAAVEILSNT